MPYDLSDFPAEYGHTLDEFKAAGLYIPKNGNGNGHERIVDCTAEEFQAALTASTNGNGHHGPGVNRYDELPDWLRKRLSTVSDKSKGEDPSKVDAGVMHCLLEARLTPEDADATLRASNRGAHAVRRKNNPDDYFRRTLADAVKKHASNGKGRLIELPADDTDWRKEFKSKNQLCRAAPRSIIQSLVPEKALTMITAPSFHGKSWIALHLGKAISVGKGLWGFNGPEQPVPFRYHVPEMDESMVHQRMEILHISDSDMFLVRAMESGTVWPLDNERMLASSRGAVVCLDTTGYFNDAEDTSSYQQAIKFGKSVFNLLTKGGALAVIGLYHPPKYSLKETTMTLENMLLGSAGYGGLLRSCLGVRNLNADPNEEDLWLYVQGLKNPRLKPFQLGGLPLTMKVKPGESPYLSAIAGTKRSNHKHEREQQVREMLARGESVRSIAEKLRMSHNTIKGIRDESDSD